MPLADLLGPVVPPPPPTATEWDRGAAGEELTARILAPLTSLGWTILHDRRLPGSGANVDHLAIAGDDIYVIDTKAWRGRVKLLADGRLWYGRTPLDSVLATITWEANVVSAHLTRRIHRPVTTHPVLCLHGAHLPGDPIHLGRLAIVTGSTLVRVLTGWPSSIDVETNGTLATVAAATFHPR